MGGGKKYIPTEREWLKKRVTREMTKSLTPESTRIKTIQTEYNKKFKGSPRSSHALYNELMRLHGFMERSEIAYRRKKEAKEALENDSALMDQMLEENENVLTTRIKKLQTKLDTSLAEERSKNQIEEMKIETLSKTDPTRFNVIPLFYDTVTNKYFHINDEGEVNTFSKNS